MAKIEKVLIPVDFSPQSNAALELATDLATRYGAALTLVHVYQVVNYAAPEGFVLYTPEQLTQLLQGYQAQLEAAKSATQQAGVQKVEVAVVPGDPFNEIIGLAEREHYDLIAMGTHGRTGVKHALLGSVAEKVVRRAPCPVLTVRVPDGAKAG